MKPGRSLARGVKNRLVPKGERTYRLPLGIGRGLRVEIDLEHWTHLYLGLYERELNPHIRELCRPGSRCFDVGGQNGYDALLFAKLGAMAVLSFDCDAIACARMARAFSNNPSLAARLDVRHTTIAARSDPAANQTTLDEAAFAPDGFVPDLVKIDIEGAELQALNGARKLLLRRRPHLIIEVHDQTIENECQTLLEEHGYTPRTVDHSRWLEDGRPSGFNRWIVAITPPSQPRR